MKWFELIFRVKKDESGLHVAMYHVRSCRASFTIAHHNVGLGYVKVCYNASLTG